MKFFDAIVLGAGPAGITAALYLVRSGITVALVEKAAPGGQILSTAEVENYPGFPKGIKGWELADLFSAHLDEYPVKRLRGDVLSLELCQAAEKDTPLLPKGAEGFEGHPALHKVVLGEGKEPLFCHALVIATGSHYKTMGVPGEEQFRGKGVSYCAVCDGNFYKDRVVAVVGGGNSALEESLYLARIVKKLYLIHRRDAFRGAMVYQEKIAAQPDKIELILNTVVDEIRGENAVQELALRQVHTGETRLLPVDGLFVFVGAEPNAGFVPKAIHCDDKGFIHTNIDMHTNIRGVFAAGDIRAKHCRQISAAVGDGASAATAAITYLEQLHA